MPATTDAGVRDSTQTLSRPCPLASNTSTNRIRQVITNRIFHSTTTDAEVTKLSSLSEAEAWWLRHASLADVDGLHALGSKPLVCRYLFDGSATSREYIAKRIADTIPVEPANGSGTWLLENNVVFCAGCVQLLPDLSKRITELTYLLDPDYWGQGLAVRMGWTAITQAFLSPRIDAVVAGADAPNKASFAVMQRLGMRFRRHVQYPLGPGMEYMLHRDDVGPSPRPAVLPVL
jgi:[ribosomal protein S5]-alanine N-acetyltransferase